VTKGAFSQARIKLKPEAFAELNQKGTESFYSHAPWLDWRGFRLLASDGSTAVLPNHPSITEAFGLTSFGPQADVPRSVARISLLYDVLNFITIDGRISSYTTSERALLREHLPSVVPGKDLLLLDRGYPGYGLLFELQALGIQYCIRLRDDWWLDVRKMIKEGITDQQVVFRLPKDEQALRQAYPDAGRAINCRIVIVTLADGSRQVFCTSLNQQDFPAECFAELYHYRWNIEEGYKLYKSRMALEAFSGKTAIAVKQDFYAGIFMMTTAAVMAFPVAQEVRKLKTDRQKHSRQINRVNALSFIKTTAKSLFTLEKIKKVLAALDRILRASTEIVRSDRKAERKKLKKKPPSINYKHL